MAPARVLVSACLLGDAVRSGAGPLAAAVLVVVLTASGVLATSPAQA